MKKNLLFCCSLFALTISSCESDFFPESDSSEIVQLEIASSKAELSLQSDAYWAREKGTYSWQLFNHDIKGLSYEPGMEYSISVEKKGDDYRLVSVDAMTRKHSVVPRFYASDQCPDDDVNWSFCSRWIYDERTGDSLYLFQGDMLLNKRQYDEMLESATRSVKMHNHPFKSYWKNKKVYYIYDSGFTHQAEVQAAIQKWEKKTLLKFIQGTGNGNYIRFINDDSDPNIAGYSQVGCVGGMQILALGSASTVGTAMHEIGHALGLHHEQCRNDRDLYITVYWENIPSNLQNNYTIDQYSLDVGSFDFSSIMMYSSWINGTVCMRTIDGYTFGCQRSYISDGDSAGIASVPTYGLPLCDLTCNEVTTYYDVSGSVEERIFEDIYTINLYADRYKLIPYTLTVPKTVQMSTVRERWNSSTNNLETTRTYWNFTIPAGYSSYTFDTIENHIYYFNSEPGYGYDVKTYELIDQ